MKGRVGPYVLPRAARDGCGERPPRRVAAAGCEGRPHGWDRAATPERRWSGIIPAEESMNEDCAGRSPDRERATPAVWRHRARRFVLGPASGKFSGCGTSPPAMRSGAPPTGTFRDRRASRPTAGRAWGRRSSRQSCVDRSAKTKAGTDSRYWLDMDPPTRRPSKRGSPP
jgi:hypothetical protein